MNIRFRKTLARNLLLASVSLWLLSGCSKSPTGSAGNGAPAQVTDADVTFKVQAALLQDGVAKDLQIAVVTRKGDVRLTGMVGTAAQRDHVVALARGADGVHSIHDELTVKP